MPVEKEGKRLSNYFWFSSALTSVPKRDHGILPNELEQDPGILENIEETLGMLSQLCFYIYLTEFPETYLENLTFH